MNFLNGRIMTKIYFIAFQETNHFFPSHFTEIDEKNIEEALYGSKLPSWCFGRDSLPAVYKKIFGKSTAFDGEIETKRIYPLLLASNVSKEKLRDIWGMANKKNPGTLIEEELYLVLGLIALAQVNAK